MTKTKKTKKKQIRGIRSPAAAAVHAEHIEIVEARMAGLTTWLGDQRALQDDELPIYWCEANIAGRVAFELSEILDFANGRNLS